MVNDHVRRLGLVLGDQLSFDLSLFDELDPAHDALLMAEVREEASYVPHHPHKIVLVFSAMRHFAAALEARGWRVIYVRLDAVDNSGSLAGELRRWHAALGEPALHLTECGEWRVEESLRSTGLPLTWHADRRFLCSREAFAKWAGNRRQLRMELFYREMRKRTGLLLEPDGQPLGAAGISTPTTARRCPRARAAPSPPGSARTRSPARWWPWWASGSPGTTAAWKGSTTR